MAMSILAPECEHIQALLPALRDADPDPAVVQRIAEHLAGCPHCRAVEAELNVLMTQYRLEASPPLPAHLEDRLLQLMCGPHMKSRA